MSNTAHSTDTLAASQLAIVSRSTARLDRARAHAASLDAHARELRTRLDAAAGDPTAGPIRGELVEIDRQREQAVAILTSVEAEHARHTGDLAALYGADGRARVALAEAHQVRDAARTAADAAKGVLNRATIHAGTVEDRLAAARADEARYDAEASARLHAALRDDTEAPATIEPFVRTSPGLEEDFRAASAVEARAASEHRVKLAALVEAERKVRGAADAVLLAEADAMAREIAALDARSDLLRDKLRTYTGRTPGDFIEPSASTPDPTRNPWSPPPAPISLMTHRPLMASSPAIAAALVDRSYVVERPRDTSAEVRAWNAYADALATDAEATADFSTALSGPAPLPLMHRASLPASSDPRPVAA